MKAALVNSENIVENIIMWDDQSEAPDGFQAILLDDDAHVSIGFIFNDKKEFIDPIPIPVREDPIDPPQPTLAELQAQLSSLQEKINLIIDQNSKPKTS